IHVCGHDVDILKWLFDDEVEKIYAESGSFIRKKDNQADNIVIILRFKKGGIGIVESSWTLPNTFPTEENDTRIDIIGTSGNMIINNMDQMIALCNQEKGWQYPGILRWPGGANEPSGLSSYALKDELTHFIKCIRDNKSPVVTLTSAKETLEILFKANETIERGVPVYMEK